MIFPEADVRFIAINNGVDSASQQDSDFTPFLNIINEWYAKDTSKKIRAVFVILCSSQNHRRRELPIWQRQCIRRHALPKRTQAR